MHFTRMLGFAATVLVLATSAHAQGKDKSKDKEKGHDERDKHGQVGRDERDKHGQVRTSAGTIILDERDVRRVPPGLAKKPGQMPPGQYKKRYRTHDGAIVLGDIMRRRGYSVIRVVPSGTSQYVYYRLSDGSERRAIVSPGTDRLRFQNVPASLLQEVLARLY